MQTENYFDESRFVRQMRYRQLGPEGQQKLSRAHVGIVGCGALGSATALSLTRAGIGTLTIIDRDVPEWSNLPRQLLYTEKDVRDGLPKAIIADQRLREIDSNVHVIPHVADLTAHNIFDLLSSVDIIVDGTDNFETRFLMNDFACSEGIPWIYGG
ncbi:MAG: ThiF family adenylyltransferase, partial [Pirellulales bacterium]